MRTFVMRYSRSFLLLWGKQMSWIRMSYQVNSWSTNSAPTTGWRLPAVKFRSDYYLPMPAFKKQEFSKCPTRHDVTSRLTLARFPRWQLRPPPSQREEDASNL